MFLARPHGLSHAAVVLPLRAGRRLRSSASIVGTLFVRATAAAASWRALYMGVLVSAVLSAIAFTR